MSQFLFPHSRVAPSALKFRLAVLGTVTATAFALFLGVLGLQTIGVLGPGTRVTVMLPTVGDTLGINSKVKYRGLNVGRVIEVDPGAGSAEPSAKVIIKDEHAQWIPADVKARVLPSTLFGNEFVELVSTSTVTGITSPTAAAAQNHLRSGQVVAADTSEATLRLMETLEDTQRLLASADPSQWSEALSQLARTLDGRGHDLAEFIDDANAFMQRWEAVEPQVMTDLRLLTDVLELLSEVEPVLVLSLENSRPIARMLVNREADLAELMTTSRSMIEDGEYGAIVFISEEGPRTSALLAATAPTLEAFAERSPAFRELLAKVPTVLVNGAAAVVDGKIQMEGVIAPQFLEPYGPEDCPEYRGLRGRCGGGR
jgi:virulence factor Mce-like protein